MDSLTLEQCTHEICDLHNFFQAWFAGELANDEVNFQRFLDVMDANFLIVAPDGVLTDLAALISRLRSAYGNYADIRIWTENHRLHHRQGDVALCTYEEWQETTELTTARVSSVLFTLDEHAPNGVRWVHVHETWLAN